MMTPPKPMEKSRPEMIRYSVSEGVGMMTAFLR
jgi:hypothetical protein